VQFSRKFERYIKKKNKSTVWTGSGALSAWEPRGLGAGGFTRPEEDSLD